MEVGEMKDPDKDPVGIPPQPPRPDQIPPMTPKDEIPPLPPNATPALPPSRRPYSLAVAYALAFLFGCTGAHHFYLGRRRWGVLYLMTCGLGGIGYIVDLVRMPWLVRRVNASLGQPEYRRRQVKVAEGYLVWAWGMFGAHHFFLGDLLWGFVYLLTCGLFTAGWIADAFNMPRIVSRYNAKLEEEASTRQGAPREPSARGRDVLVAIRLAVFPLTGLFGGHHYYMGRRAFGIFCTLTLGGFGIVYVADWFRTRRIFFDVERRKQEGRSLSARRLDDCYLLALPPFGMFGAHHFYLGRPGWGVLYCTTCGLWGVGWVIDMFRLPRLVREHNKVDADTTASKGPLEVVSPIETPQDLPKEVEALGNTGGTQLPPPQYTSTLAPGVYHGATLPPNYNVTSLPGVEMPAPPAYSPLGVAMPAIQPEYSPDGALKPDYSPGGAAQAENPPSYDESLEVTKDQEP